MLISTVLVSISSMDWNTTLTKTLLTGTTYGVVPSNGGGYGVWQYAAAVYPKESEGPPPGGNSCF